MKGTGKEAPHRKVGRDRAGLVLVIGTEPAMLLKFHGPLLAALQREGFEVHAAACGLRQSGSYFTALSSLGVVTHDIAIERTGMNPARDLRTLLELYKLIRRLKPQVTLGYTVKPVIYGTLAAWLARVPHRFALITGLGYAFTGDARGLRAAIQTVVRALYRVALGFCEKVFFQNRDDEQLFRKLRILRPSVPSRVLDGCGVDTGYFGMAPFPQTALTVVMVARLVGDKGVREYARAAMAVRKRHPDARFLLVGGLDSNPEALPVGEVEAWQASGALTWLGQVADVRQVLASAHVFVLPSYREGLPQSTIEAMSMGRPVITTDVPGCRETVIDGDNGFMIPPRSPDALAHAICRFLDRPELVREMGLRSRRMAEDRFDVNKVNSVVLQEMGLSSASTSRRAADLQ